MQPLKDHQALEHMIELLAEASDPQDALRQGFHYLLEQANCPGGVVFFESRISNRHLTWFAKDIPQAWQENLEARRGGIYDAAQAIFATGKAMLPRPELELVGGIPLTIKENTLGGLFFYHPDAIELPLDELARLARPLAVSISYNMPAFNGYTLLNSGFFEIITAAQDVTLNLHDIQARVADSIRKLVDPNGIGLFLYYPEKNNFLEKIELVGPLRRQEQSALYLRPSLVETCIQRKGDVWAPDLALDSYYNHEIDDISGVDATAALCMPMIAGGIIIGVVEMLFLEEPKITSEQMKMLTTLVRSLGFAVVNGRMVQQLRVANADIEANRWEVIRSRNILRALFDTLPSSIYIIDQTSKIVAINMSRARRNNTHPMQVVGKKCYEALYERSEPCPGCLVNETLFAGVNTIRNSRVWSEDQPIDWEITTYAILNERNIAAQAIVIEQDVTEKRRLEANLVQSEKLAAVGQLAAGVAHEINNPLAAVIANAQILARDLVGDEEKLESVKLIEMAGVRASQVVKNLLGFARKDQYDFESIDLNETLQNAFKLLQHELLSHSVTLKTDLDEDMPNLLASRDHLQGVWVNLMMNALDAMDGQEGRLQVSTRYVTNEFRVTIADSGHGIPPERISRIFEPFYTTKSPGRGTGLGLSLCHRIVKHHGGYITVDSQIGVGTQFTVVLPTNSRTNQAKSQGG
jgi:signal transduction histidine kinase